MFCYKCGKQIRDDSSFCQYCGTAQNSVMPVSQKETREELDREALKVYLGNVLSLECIKANYLRRIDNLRSKIYNANQPYFKCIKLREGKGWASPIYVNFYSDGKKIYIAKNAGKYASSEPSYMSYYSISHAEINDCKWVPIEDGPSEKILQQVGYLSGAYDSGAGFFAKREQVEEAQKKFPAIYTSFKKEASQLYQKNTKAIASCKNSINGLDNELKTVTRLLKEAYNANIIPESFRYKIHAIYYLYSFISTSQESLTTALLHCDLDEIKKKLDKIIAQQETIIIQQAVAMAQNQQMIQQNQQQLEHLASIETNTQRSAQYAQIAASHAETCAWISMANYIDRQSQR